MNVDYSGESFQYDHRSRTYSRAPVKVRFPCSACGSSRSEKWVQGASGGWSLKIEVCCENRQQPHKGERDGTNKREQDEV